MRITRLSFAGFGPYRDQQEIDFRAFEDDGIYLIGGRTGAGKSTILDAVCFALYDSVPRFDATKSEARLRSDHSGPDDPTWVELEFLAGGHEYRIRRSPAYDRPKARGEGMTTQAASVRLDVKEGDGWRSIAAKQREVGDELERIVQLRKDQFLQVVMLAQNQFQQFLAAKQDDRQRLLRSLFATERFSSFEAYLVERRKIVEGELGAELDTVRRLADRARELAASLPEITASPEPAETIAPTETTTPTETAEATEAGDAVDEEWFARTVSSALALRSIALEHLEQADAEATAAEEADRRAEDLARRIIRRDAAVAERDRLARRADEDRREREERDRAHAAAPLWPLVEAVDASGRRVSEASRRKDQADGAFGTAVAGLDVSDPADAVERLTRELGTLEDAAADERSLPGLERAVEEAARLLDDARRAEEEAAARRRVLPDELEAARSALSAATTTAARLDGATATVESLKRQRSAAHDVISRARTLASARQAEADALAASRDAASHLQHVLTARLSGFAAELAGRLIDGEPCDVCGSTSHPAPAVPVGELIGEEDIESAHAAIDERGAELAGATRHAREAEAAHQQALVAAGGATVDELDAALTTAEAERDACASASARVPALRAAVETLLAEIERADEDAAALAMRRDALAADHVVAVTRRDEVAIRVAEARGVDASVADRVERTATRRAAADEAVAAAAALEERRLEQREAVRRLDEALSGSADGDAGFADVDEVRSAHRSAADLRALDGRVTKASDERTTNAAVLADPDLADLPSIAPDTAATAAVRLATRASRDDALAALREIERCERELAVIRTDALSALSAVRARRDEVDAIRGLADTVEGKAPNTRRMDLETFVLAAQLEQIIAAANRRFQVMTSGRFSLEHDDSIAYRNAASGLGLAIRDEYTGRSRPTASLSGGETFLAALALALGLAEVVTERAGGITLETLFIDEGFGSLDGETLEIAMSTLDELRAGGRTVGLISHVDAMKERISARLTVEVDETGASRVRQQGAPAVV